MKRLADNFQRFGTTVEKMSDIAEVSKVTADYTKKTQEAAVALGQMKDAYTASANTVKHFNEAAEGTRAFHEQVQTLTKNLGSLNTIYELELQDTNTHLKAMNAFYSNLVNASQTMQNSADDAKKTQEQIALLAKNLGNLNSVYGNMLAAMQGRS
jgi:gliding motility-associated protein GldL